MIRSAVFTCALIFSAQCFAVIQDDPIRPQSFAICEQFLTAQQTSATAEGARGFLHATQLKVGAKVYVVKKSPYGVVSADEAIIESITRDYHFIVKMTKEARRVSAEGLWIERETRVVDWRAIVVPNSLGNLNVGDKVQYYDYLNRVSGTYLGHTLDDTRVVIRHDKTVNGLDFNALVGVTEAMTGAAAIPLNTKVYYSVQSTYHAALYAAELVAINGDKAVLKLENREETVHLSAIANPVSIFTPDQQVVLENANGKIEYGYILGQFANGDLVFTDETKTKFQAVDPVQVSKLRRDSVDSGVEGGFAALTAHGHFTPETVTNEVLSYKLIQLLDDSVFEESLSLGEYPDLVIEQKEKSFDVTIGSSRFSTAKGDKILYLDPSNGYGLFPSRQRVLEILTEGGETFRLLMTEQYDGSKSLGVEVVLQYEAAGVETPTILAIFGN